MRLSALFPLACAIMGFVLSMLCLLAGHKRGFMEDYHVITLNTSTLGHELIPTPTSDSDNAPTPTSIGSFFSSLAHNATEVIEGELGNLVDDLNEIVGEVADKLAGELGISQWYSFHLLDMCEGTYKPNATAKGANKNITHCTNQTAMHHFDITSLISSELEVGPFDLSIEDLGWTDDIQEGLDDLNTLLDATFVLYAIGIAAAGCAIIAAVLAFFLHGSRLISFGNWGLATLSFVTLLIASIIITIFQKKGTHIINKYGNEIGLYAYKGNKFLIITWVSVAAMFLASCAWVVEFCIGRKNKRREYTEKGGATDGGWMSRRKQSDEAALRRSGV